MQQIFDGKLRSRGTGIGIRNIHDRIRLMFGEPYGLSIESEVGSGTWVTIRYRRMRGMLMYKVLLVDDERVISDGFLK